MNEVMTNKTPRVYAFIDSQNLNLGTQKFGWKMNWQKFRKFLEDKYGVTKAFMFIGYVPEFEDMYERLRESGYAIVLKPTYDMTRPREETTKPEAEDKKPVKGNIDAELVLWTMKEINNYDKAIIVSGDGDFYCIVEYLHEQGKLLKLMVPSPHYSSLFNRFESYIENIYQYRRQLAYRDSRKFRKKPAQERNTTNS